MATRLNSLDLAFLALETQKTPVNVAALEVFEIPKGYKGNYVRDLLDKLRSIPAGPPFNLRLNRTHPGLFPSWVEDKDFDLDFHVRHSALPKPGTMDDLMALASRLHSRVLDRERPLWEFHIIEGLSRNRFALYMKMHHAAIDGMGGVEVIESCFSENPDAPLRAPWEAISKKARKRSNKGWLQKLGSNLNAQAQRTQELGKIFLAHGQKGLGLKADASPIPFTAPKSLFNVEISGARRFAVDTLSLQDIKQLGKQADATVNDMVLAICSGALRKYLLSHNALPKRSLVATVPVSVRQVNRSGNQITYVAANLYTEVDDVLERLRKIGESTRQAKEEIEDVSAGAATTFAMMAQGMVAVLNQLNITELLPPPANVTISNVPGPKKPLYFGGARMLANYPMSVLVNGQALNITVVSYCDSVDFGLMACRDALPDLKDLNGYISDALEELRAAIAKAHP